MVAFSIVIGLLMIVLFGYTSNQKAIKIAKDQLKQLEKLNDKMDGLRKDMAETNRMQFKK